MTTAAEQFQDQAISHAIYLQRHSLSVQKRVLKILAKSDARIVATLASEDLTEWARAREEALLKRVRDFYAVTYKQVNGEIAGAVKDLANYESDFYSDMAKHLIPDDIHAAIGVAVPTGHSLYAAATARPFGGKLLKEWGQQLEAGALSRVKDEIKMGYLEGRTTAQMVRAIRGTKAAGYKDGVLDISRRGAEAMVRTAISHTSNVASETFYKENPDLVKGVKWVSILDNKTTAVCRGRDGQVYPVGKGPRPPAHINCRSVTSPVLKSWKEMGINKEDTTPKTRAAMDGVSPPDETYGDWLKKHSADFQDDILGKTKGQLFRKGDLTLDRFIDKSGREYTIEELKYREKEAWAKAFGGPTRST